MWQGKEGKGSRGYIKGLYYKVEVELNVEGCFKLFS